MTSHVQGAWWGPADQMAPPAGEWLLVTHCSDMYPCETTALFCSDFTGLFRKGSVGQFSHESLMRLQSDGSGHWVSTMAPFPGWQVTRCQLSTGL